MIRVKDAEKSLKFYQETMGMTHIHTIENPDNKFNLYFLGYTGTSSPPTQAHREGLLELTWNYGTEKETDFKYHDGNSDPQGFGHIAVSVDDLDKACARFEEKGVAWKKRLTDGRMKNVAFVSIVRCSSVVCTDAARFWILMGIGLKSFRTRGSRGLAIGSSAMPARRWAASPSVS